MGRTQPPRSQADLSRSRHDLSVGHPRSGRTRRPPRLPRLRPQRDCPSSATYPATYRRYALRRSQGADRPPRACRSSVRPSDDVAPSPLEPASFVCCGTVVLGAPFRACAARVSSLAWMTRRWTAELGGRGDPAFSFAAAVSSTPFDVGTLACVTTCETLCSPGRCDERAGLPPAPQADSSAAEIAAAAEVVGSERKTCTSHRMERAGASRLPLSTSCFLATTSTAR